MYFRIRSAWSSPRSGVYGQWAQCRRRFKCQSSVSMICDKYNFYRASHKIVFAKFIIEDTEHVCTRHNDKCGPVSLWGSLWPVNTELTLNLLTCTKGVFRRACAFNQIYCIKHANYYIQRWKVTNYIYSRYCNWVAFLCTCTFLSNIFNL